jgi:putative nucleotidyltransferase with HDIG domain
VLELNKVYLNTVESLAMAIDAKDQIMHGHVRRVQIFASGLAKAAGMRDEGSLRWMEAAALLHDIGKLAIPEYILNKPGKLTRAEFNKVMVHPVVGSDILSSINFPYDVARDVRHHHENWDGSGYPDGLKGTDISPGPWAARSTWRRRSRSSQARSPSSFLRPPA